MNIDYIAIGKRIKKLRLEKHWSQEKLREKIDISKTHMSHIESGTTKLSLPVLIEIANALGTTTDHILMDNVECTIPVFEQDIQEILNDCNTYEMRAMVETMSLVKNTIRNIPKEQEFEK